MNNLEILLDVLIHPSYALRRGDKSLSLSIAVVVLAVWSAVVGNYIIRGISINAASLLFSIIGITLFALLFNFIIVSVWHFISESFKGRGRANELFICVCLSFLPYIFLAPLALIIKFSGGGLVYWPFFKFVIAVWVITLQISSIRIVYQLNGPLAAASYFIPFAAFLIIFFLMFVVLALVFVIIASQSLTPLLNL